MAIGSLGEIVFEVTDKRVFTFDDLKRDSKMRYTAHEVIGRKPVTEFIGPDLEQISFKIYLSAAIGINPEREMKRIRDKRDAGEALTLILGDKVIGDNKWVIESIGESYLVVDQQGRIWTLSAEITLKEYVEQIGDKKAPAATAGAVTSTGDDASGTQIAGDGDGGENPAVEEV